MPGTPGKITSGCVGIRTAVMSCGTRLATTCAMWFTALVRKSRTKIGVTFVGMLATVRYLLARMVLNDAAWYATQWRGKQTLRAARWYGIPKRKHWWRSK